MTEVKKLLILSDTHEKSALAIRVMNTEKPDMIVHLGDCTKDAEDLKYCTKLPLVSVRGNCDDDCTIPESAEFTVNGIRFLAVHGHKYRVKLTTAFLEAAGHSASADAVLFGHTHIPFLKQGGGIFMMNPGSLGSPHLGKPATYGIITLLKGQINGVIKEI